MNLNQDIPVPFRCSVMNRYFYNGRQVEPEPTTRCTVFAISSFVGLTPTFIIMMDNGAVFHGIPVHALQQQKELAGTTLPPDSLVYQNCPDNRIAVNEHAFLKGEVLCLIRKDGATEWHNGHYVMTIDWPYANANMHLIALDNGQYCIYPNHEVLFRSNSRVLPPYLKLRRTFSLPSGES